jgi:beta-carotene hydroxylase
MSNRDLTMLTPKELARIEREIARKHIGKFPWLAVTAGIGVFIGWLALWPLVLMNIIPAWAGFIAATIFAIIGYLPSHEAQHDIIARPGSRLRWLNELVGHVSTVPLALPFDLARVTHREHHLHTNHPELDPDHGSSASGPLMAIWTAIQNVQPKGRGGHNAYSRTLKRLGRKDVLISSALYRVAWFLTLFALAWTGHAIEAAALWWLPHHVGYIYIQYYLSWAPHHPAHETARYRHTRSFRAALGNIGSLGMQYHIVHHLHPRIPFLRTPEAYWEMKPVLEAQGARVEDL